MLNRDRVSLILMDMIMPKKGGKEAYAEIQAIKPDARVLFSSGYTQDFIESHANVDTGIELIMKPVRPSELLTKIRQTLDTQTPACEVRHV